MRLCFTITYSDGSVTRGATRADWLAMPDEGVLVVTEFFDRLYGHPRKHCGLRHAGVDYYYMDAAGAIGAGNAKHLPAGPLAVKRGALVDAATWERLYNRACIDPPAGAL